MLATWESPAWEALLDEGYAAINNWVDLRRFPFSPDLGKGACFIGREYKSLIASIAASVWDEKIDCYADQWTQDYPANMIWSGFGDTAEVAYRYRLCFASALAALECMAAGRFVICGQPHALLAAESRLVLPENVDELARGRFAYRGALDANIQVSPSAVMESVLTAMRGGHMLRERRRLREWVEEYRNGETQMARVFRFYEKVIATAKPSSPIRRPWGI